jgi:ATP phosphoribosyltransferase regulatory subunit
MVRPVRYPTGVRPLLVDAAARRKRIEQRFVEQLDAAGFSEVILPILDYVDVYEPVTPRDAAKKTYRFVDRDGDLVALRSDFTPMLARALAPSMNPDELPLRVYYRGDVIRCDRTRLGANREMFQIGAEIIGDNSVDADVAILQLASALAGNATVIYTDAGLVTALTNTSPAIRDALATKRSSRDPLATKLLAGTATLSDVAPLAPDAAIRLATIAQRLGKGFVLNLADVDDLTSYYTGIRFSVYAAGSNAKIAQGGRYDNLYERFGAAAPAVGFTFTIDDLD